MHDLAKYAAALLCPGGTQGRRFVKAPPRGREGACIRQFIPVGRRLGRGGIHEELAQATSSIHVGLSHANESNRKIILSSSPTKEATVDGNSGSGSLRVIGNTSEVFSGVKGNHIRAGTQISGLVAKHLALVNANDHQFVRADFEIIDGITTKYASAIARISYGIVPRVEQEDVLGAIQANEGVIALAAFEDVLEVAVQDFDKPCIGAFPSRVATVPVKLASQILSLDRVAIVRGDQQVLAKAYPVYQRQRRNRYRCRWHDRQSQRRKYLYPQDR